MWGLLIPSCPVNVLHACGTAGANADPLKYQEVRQSCVVYFTATVLRLWSAHSSSQDALFLQIHLLPSSKCLDWQWLIANWTCCGAEDSCTLLTCWRACRATVCHITKNKKWINNKNNEKNNKSHVLNLLNDYNQLLQIFNDLSSFDLFHSSGNIRQCCLC